MGMASVNELCQSLQGCWGLVVKGILCSQKERTERIPGAKVTKQA